VIASSTTVISNLAYLIGAVVVAVIGGLGVWLHHRQPKSVDANMASFRRGLSVLAPEPRSDTAGPAIRGDSQSRIRAIPGGLTHVRIDRVPDDADGARDRHTPAAEEAAGKRAGRQPG
jgi:hypothetical protein